MITIHRNITRVVLAANNVGELGGVGTFMRILGSAFQNRGYDVDLLGFDVVEEHGDFGKLSRRTMYETPNPGRPRPSNYSLNVRDPRYKRDLKRYNEIRDAAAMRTQPVIESFDSSTAVIVAQVWAMENMVYAGFHPADRHGPIVFGQHHASFEQARAGGYVSRIISAFAEADQFVALTDEDARLFMKAGVPSVAAIPNPVDTPYGFSDAKAKSVVALARFAKIKRLDRLISAWSLLIGEFPDWKLELWGDGELRDALESQIHRLGLSDSISLPGRTDNPAEVFSRSAINVISSDSEGLPFTIIESARRHLPTVATDCCPAIRELIGNGTSGLVVPRNSVEGLAKGLRMLMTDQDLRVRMGNEAFSRSLQYEPDHIVDRWEREFERALR